MEKENLNVSISEHRYLGLIILSVVVILVQLVVGFIIYKSHHHWTERGQFGDMFGAVNTLFSGLAFAGVIYAIFLQRGELELQREEITLTRTELNRPVVTARVATHDGGNTGIALNIIVQNTGNRPAKNVRLLVKEKDLEEALLPNADDKFKGHVKRCFSDEGIIPILENGRSVSNSFGAMGARSGGETWKVNSMLNIEVLYQGLDDRVFSHIIPLKVSDDAGFAGSFWEEKKGGTGL